MSSKFTTTLLCSLCAVLSACSAKPPRADQELPQGLLQGRFQGIYDAPIQLTDGRYAGPAFVDGGASRPTVTLLQDRVARGDLDATHPDRRAGSNGAAATDDFAVLLSESSGGSGSFLYLAVLRPRGGELVNLATTLLGDRVRVRSLTITDGEIRVSMLVHGPEDPVCCPSKRAEKSWQLIGNEISEVIGFSGHLVYGHEAREFVPCGKTSAWWVVDGTAGELPAAYRKQAPGPYTPIYVEVRGATGPTPNAEFARPYPRQIRITELLHATGASAGCPPQDPLRHGSQQQ